MKTQFLTKTFVDFAGVERSFTVAAVLENRETIPLTSREAATVHMAIAEGEGKDLECRACAAQEAFKSIDSMLHTKRVAFGVSFCHPSDMKVENPELGKTIAMGKAKCAKTRIGEINMTSGMFINSEHINLCLERFAELIARNPENYSLSYAIAKEKFEEKHKNN